jgi:hypothetical protein
MEPSLQLVDSFRTTGDFDLLVHVFPSSDGGGGWKEQQLLHVKTPISHSDAGEYQKLRNSV